MRGQIFEKSILVPGMYHRGSDFPSGMMAGTFFCLIYCIRQIISPTNKENKGKYSRNGIDIDRKKLYFNYIILFIFEKI